MIDRSIDRSSRSVKNDEFRESKCSTPSEYFAPFADQRFRFCVAFICHSRLCRCLFLPLPPSASFFLPAICIFIACAASLSPPPQFSNENSTYAIQFSTIRVSTRVERLESRGGYWPFPTNCSRLIHKYGLSLSPRFIEMACTFVIVIDRRDTRTYERYLRKNVRRPVRENTQYTMYSLKCTQLLDIRKVSGPFYLCRLRAIARGSVSFLESISSTQLFLICERLCKLHALTSSIKER